MSFAGAPARAPLSPETRTEAAISTSSAQGLSTALKRRLSTRRCRRVRFFGQDNLMRWLVTANLAENADAGAASGTDNEWSNVHHRAGPLIAQMPLSCLNLGFC